MNKSILIFVLAFIPYLNYAQDTLFYQKDSSSLKQETPLYLSQSDIFDVMVSDTSLLCSLPNLLGDLNNINAFNRFDISGNKIISVISPKTASKCNSESIINARNSTQAMPISLSGYLLSVLPKYIRNKGVKFKNFKGKKIERLNKDTLLTTLWYDLVILNPSISDSSGKADIDSIRKREAIFQNIKDSTTGKWQASLVKLSFRSEEFSNLVSNPNFLDSQSSIFVQRIVIKEDTLKKYARGDSINLFARLETFSSIKQFRFNKKSPFSTKNIPIKKEAKELSVLLKRNNINSYLLPNVKSNEEFKLTIPIPNSIPTGENYYLFFSLSGKDSLLNKNVYVQTDTFSVVLPDSISTSELTLLPLSIHKFKIREQWPHNNRYYLRLEWESHDIPNITFKVSQKNKKGEDENIDYFSVIKGERSSIKNPTNLGKILIGIPLEKVAYQATISVSIMAFPDEKIAKETIEFGNLKEKLNRKERRHYKRKQKINKRRRSSKF